MKKLLRAGSTLAVLLALVSRAYAQAPTGGIGIGTTTPNPSALLDLTSSTRGLLAPRMTAAERAAIQNPANGLLVFQTDGIQLGFWYHQTGSGWTYLNPTGADNLGNHSATQSLAMNGNPISFGTALTQQLNLWNTDYAIGVQPSTLLFRTGSSFAWYKGGAYAATQNDPGTGGSAQMLLTDEGNLGVGIGAAAPQHRLHVGGRMMLDGGVIQRGGAPITGTIDLGLYQRNAGNWMRFVTNGGAIRFYSDDNTGTTPNLSIESNGNVAVGSHNASNRLDVQVGGRSGTHATDRPLYVTGDLGEASNGVEFRHSNGTQGVGIGYNSLYATGSNADQPLNLIPKGAGGVGVSTTTPRGHFDVDGPGDIYLADDPVAGTSQTLYLPGHIYVAPHAGSNLSYLQARRADNSGSTSLRVRTYNAGSLTEALQIEGNGNVGIGAMAPTQKLHVAGQVYSSSGGFRFPDNTVQTTAAANQQLTKSGSTISLTSGGSVTDADNQNLSLSGATLGIAGGNSVTLPDASSTNEAQTISKTGSTVTLTSAGGAGGGSFTDSDNQSLSISGNTISLTNGGSVTVAAGADNLGNHTATQNLNLATSQLVGNGGTSGLSISNGGSVGIGTTTPNAKAALDITSVTKGMLPPRMNTTQRNALAPGITEAGMLVYNTDQGSLNMWDGGRWVAYLPDNSPTTGNPYATATFSFTGAPQTYTVPIGVTRLTVDVRGAAGGGASGGFPGGNGGRVQGVLTVTPGQVLTVYVGSNGGYNGGGISTSSAGGHGGGASDVRVGGTALTDRVVVAGGGGGSTWYISSGYGGGAGGGLTGGNGGSYNGTGGSYTGGRGGSQSAGGGGGFYGAQPGSFGAGGNGGTNGAGGGGGYYGGGGGEPISGGGGGSSYTHPTLVASVNHTQNFQSGNGLVSFTPLDGRPAPVLDASNFINVPGDNLGNHNATQRLNLGTNKLVGNAGTAGLAISSTGNVTLDGTLSTAGAITAGGKVDLGANQLVGNGGTSGLSVTAAGNVGVGIAATERVEANGNVKITGGGNGLIFPDGTKQTTKAINDNLGNHTATQTLQLGANAVQFSTVLGSKVNLWNAEYAIGVQGGTQYFRSGEAFAWYVGGGQAANQFDAGGGLAQMTLKNRKLGIGTSTEAVAPLEIQRDDADAYLTMHDPSNAWFSFGMHQAEGNKIKINDGNNFSGANLLTILRGSGNVGIGTTSPAAKLDVQGSGYIGGYNLAYFAYNGSIAIYGASGNNNSDVSIRASNRIVGAEFNATSDRRLKNVVGLSDNAADLGLLRRLRITDYTMRDRVQYGDRAFKKVIAQEVEEVFPQAVLQHLGFLPDIYANATAAEAVGDSLLRVTLPKAVTGAQAGQRVKLIGVAREVLGTVAQASTGTTLLVRGARGLTGQQVFVFGLEHPDVRTVDYEALAMLNVSATQELARQVETLQKQLIAQAQEAETLRAQLGQQHQQFEQLRAQSTQTAELTQRLNALEAALNVRAEAK